MTGLLVDTRISTSREFILGYFPRFRRRENWVHVAYTLPLGTWASLAEPGAGRVLSSV
jgi:hypothetical protein